MFLISDPLDILKSLFGCSQVLCYCVFKIHYDAHSVSPSNLKSCFLSPRKNSELFLWYFLPASLLCRAWHFTFWFGLLIILSFPQLSVHFYFILLHCLGDFFILVIILLAFKRFFLSFKKQNLILLLQTLPSFNSEHILCVSVCIWNSVFCIALCYFIQWFPFLYLFHVFCSSLHLI